MGVKHICFLTMQERGSKLNSACAHHESRSHLSTVGDATGGNNRDTHCVNNLRQQGYQGWLQTQVDPAEGTAMASSLKSLRNNRIHPSPLKRSGLRNCRRTGNDEDAGVFYRLNNFWLRHSKMETHHLRLRAEKHIQMLGGHFARRIRRIWNRSKLLRGIMRL